MDRPAAKKEVFRGITAGRRILRFFFGLVFLLFLLLGAFFTVVQLPVVQQWGIGRLTEAIRDKTGGESRIGRFYLTWQGELRLEDVYLEDMEGDTLIRAGIIGTRILRDLRGLFTGRMEISDLFLGKTTLRLRHYPDGTTNIDRMVALFFPPDPDKKKGRFDLQIRQVRLDQFRYLERQDASGKDLEVWSGRAFIEVKCMRFQPLDLEFGQVRASGPMVRIRTSEGTPPAEKVAVAPSGPKKPYNLSFESIKLTGGQLILEDESQDAPEPLPGSIDYRRMDLGDLALEAEGFRLDEQHHYASGAVKISAREKSGFVLEELVLSRADVQRTGARLEGLRIKTPYSEAGDSLHFTYQDYPDFLDFNNRVFMEGYFRNSRIRVRDLLYFAPSLDQVPYFRENPDLDIHLEGHIGSRVNNLRGRDVILSIGDQLRFRGDFGSRNLALRGEQSLNLKIADLTTSMPALSRIIPGFRPPPAFRKLGRLRFTGRFDGFLVDFVSFGELTTDLGRANLDMRMNLKNGAARAEYSGNMAVRKFDLARWTGNDDLGDLTFHAQVRNGRGLTIDHLEAELQATVDSVSYKNYVYRNLKMDGLITRDRFEGQFDIRDEAIDFFFEGFVQYRDSLPLFDFRAIVNRIDLYRLHFTKSPLTLAAILDFNLRGRSLKEMNGMARAVRLEMDQGGDRKGVSDSVVIRLDQPRPGYRIVELDSDIANARLEGDFQLFELADIFGSRLVTHFPEFVQRRNIRVVHPDSLTSRSLVFRVQDRKLHDFLSAFRPGFPNLDGAVAEGELDLRDGTTRLVADLPLMAVQDVTMEHAMLELVGNGPHVSLTAGTELLGISDQTAEKVKVRLTRTDKDYAFQIKADSEYPFGTDLKGNLLLDERGYHIRFRDDSLVFVNQRWDIHPDNSIFLDSNALALENVILHSASNSMEFKDYRGKGVILHLQGLDLARLNEILQYEPVRFGGAVDVDLLTRDVFGFRDFAVLVQSEDIQLNQDHYGRLYLAVAMPTLKSPVEVDFELDQLGESLSLNGTWYRGESGEGGGRVDVQLRARSFPASVAEYFLNGAIVHTKGSFDADLNLTGPLSRPEVDGYIDIAGLETVVGYLGMNYSVEKGRITANSSLFDATGIELRDPLGNKAVITGGLTHDHFKNLGLDCTIQSDHFMALNTRKEDNPHYYGTGIGKLYAQFSGPLSASNIYVRATVARGSSLSIPVSKGGSQVQQQFVEFYTSQDTLQDDQRRGRQVTGLQLEMDVEMTEDALVQIIFDERTGDILRGYGQGNIRLEIPRASNLRMFGHYTIARGDYLFTFQNIVNKSFEVERGGTIQWSGDPFDAQINMRTIYTIPSASVYNLIAEFLTTGGTSLEQAARSPTEVQLYMNLTGRLLHPDITFDLGFPRLFGEVRSLVESKMQNLRRDPNELNWQVFGLLVANNFLPPGIAGQGTEYVATINTVSEMISNQFSRYITALMSEMVSGVGIISDVGFDFNYNIYQSQSITQIEQAFTDSKIQVTQRINFYDDRLSLAIEGSVINTRGIEASSGVLLGGDFMIEYALTEDRRLKMRVYQRSEPTILGNNRYKVGAGISFRKEYE